MCKRYAPRQCCSHRRASLRRPSTCFSKSSSGQRTHTSLLSRKWMGLVLVAMLYLLLPMVLDTPSASDDPSLSLRSYKSPSTILDRGLIKELALDCCPGNQASKSENY
eukprot:Rmarinus@m.24202